MPLVFYTLAAGQCTWKSRKATCEYEAGYHLYLIYHTSLSLETLSYRQTNNRTGMHCRTQAGSQQDFKLLGHWLLTAGAFNKKLKALLDFFIFTVLILVTSHSHHPCCLQAVLLLLELETGIFYFAEKRHKGPICPPRQAPLRPASPQLPSSSWTSGGGAGQGELRLHAQEAGGGHKAEALRGAAVGKRHRGPACCPCSSSAGEPQMRGRATTVGFRTKSPCQRNIWIFLERGWMTSSLTSAWSPRCVGSVSVFLKIDFRLDPLEPSSGIVSISVVIVGPEPCWAHLPLSVFAGQVDEGGSTAAVALLTLCLAIRTLWCLFTSHTLLLHVPFWQTDTRLKLSHVLKWGVIS